LPSPAGGQVSREQVEQFLHDWSGHLVRAKGYIRIAGAEAIQLIQYAGKRTVWEPSNYPGTPYLVAIGMQLNDTDLAARWTRLWQAEVEA
jgi:hypothetical protein